MTKCDNVLPNAKLENGQTDLFVVYAIVKRGHVRATPLGAAIDQIKYSFVYKMYENKLRTFIRHEGHFKAFFCLKDRTESNYLLTNPLTETCLMCIAIFQRLKYSSKNLSFWVHVKVE